MSCYEIANLIDLSNSDDERQTRAAHVTTQLPAPEESIPSTKKTVISNKTVPTMVPECAEASFACLISSESQRRESLDNNPFDSVQKLVNRPDDPFEIVEKEACKKARSMLPPVEVKLGNLLSLSDDNLLNDDIPNDEKEYANNCRIQDADYTSSSDLYYTAATQNALDSESPPVSMSLKWTSDSNSCESGGSASSADIATSSKTNKAIEQRKRLLKLSISNSTFNSPVSRRLPHHSDCFSDGSAMSIILSEAAQSGGEHLIASESPLKLVDDDLMSEEPNWIENSENNFDADLEMLKIPMLKELPSPVIENQKLDYFALKQETMAEEVKPIACLEEQKSNSLSDLAAIRAKLKAKRAESSSQDISQLINNLKSLICDINVGGDTKKKQEASSLLDTLSLALIASKNDVIQEENEKENDASMSTLTTPPQPIVRQGTFDIELQEKEKQQAEANCANTSTSEFSHLSNPQPVHNEEIPDAMIRSSATYDGESAEEKQDFILPEVELSSAPTHPDINDIVEQLGKLLEQHQLNNMHAEHAGNDGTALQSNNPTFIVVMNTSQAPLTSGTTVPSAKLRSSFVASYLENSTNDSSPDFSNFANNSMQQRRRSQSLSIHDKLKIVQLPMLPPSSVLPGVECQDLPPSLSTPPLDAEAPEFKTPSRMMMRRNSFSNGTPYTPMTMHSNIGTTAQRRASGISDTPLQATRRSTLLSTHHELQRSHTLSKATASAVVHPMPHLNLTAMKSELNTKRKLKTNSSADSILKSSGPMKATIPVKKVAPMLKTSPPTPDNSSSKTKAYSHLNTSLNLVAKSGKMSYTSTPMPASRAAPTLNVATGFPNACSTPTARTSPMKRTATIGVNKTRYSYLSTTPNAKQTAPSAAAAAGMRRRTLTEFKSKSPAKPRVSTATGSMNTTGRTSSSRSALKLPQNVSRTACKLAPTASGRTSTRLSFRTSLGGASATHRNKENKLP